MHNNVHMHTKPLREPRKQQWRFQPLRHVLLALTAQLKVHLPSFPTSATVALKAVVATGQFPYRPASPGQLCQLPAVRSSQLLCLRTMAVCCVSRVHESLPDPTSSARATKILSLAMAPKKRSPAQLAAALRGTGATKAKSRKTSEGKAPGERRCAHHLLGRIRSLASALSRPFSHVRSVVSESCTLLHVMHSVVHALPRTTVIMSLWVLTGCTLQCFTAT